MTFPTILVNIADGIATITLNRPDKLNALNAQLLADLDAAFEELHNDHSLRCVVITGAGPKAFAAGADISELAQCDSTEGRTFAARGQLIFDRIENFRVPVIAAVNGFALGGGCELAMACHIRYASDTAKFGQPEVKLGTIPGYGGTQRLMRLCGTAVAIELMTSADMMTAARALQCGLVNAVFPASDLLTESNGLAARIASMAPLAVQAVLDAVRSTYSLTRSGYTTEQELFAQLCDSQDFKEGTTAFLEKRSAVFTGK
ncbi:MAG: enoyl-CoA hydratase/isomerase family protein [Candidatus Kapaibacterium sp.]|jgi:enoyl-CoA hydratase